MLAAWLLGAALGQDHHMIRLEDGAGVPYPCAVLETVNHARWVTDDDGYAAIYEPGLMGRSVWFEPDGVALTAPLDWLGIAGFAVTLDPGQLTTVVLARAALNPVVCGRGDIEQRRGTAGVPTAAEYHAIQVIDAETGLPVPAMGLSAFGEEHWTDNGGYVAWHHLDHMDELVSFEIDGDGYAHKTGFVDITTAMATTTVVEVDRIGRAERLVRLTGAGTWRETELLELSVPVAEPLLNADVVGQDSAHAVEWRDEIFTLWGDTSKAEYPLGNFHSAGATTELADSPADGLDYLYIEDVDGFTAEIAQRYAEGAVWLSGLVALSDDELWVSFLNISSTWVYLREGMMRWDDTSQQFVEQVAWPPDQPERPMGPALRFTGPDGDWVVYRGLDRVPADPVALADPSTYESWSPFEPDGSGGLTLQLDAEGVPDWRWRTGVPSPDREWVGLGWIDEAHSPWHNTFDPDTAESPIVHFGNVAWNPVRGRWLHVFTEELGSTSWLGEIWLAEGDTPIGPWSWARKVVTHDDYSFYNPYFHPRAAEEGGRRVLFEGTYTAWLGTDSPTPRHDYNQMLYGVDLDAVAVPVAFYDGPDGPVSRRDFADDARVAFGAHDQPAEGMVAVHWTAPSCDPERRLSTDGAGEVAFWALEAGDGDVQHADLSAWEADDGTVSWSIEDLTAEGLVAAEVVATVWRPVWQPVVPLSLYPAPERADAGPDQCNVSGPVTLDGSTSVLADGIDGWSWSWDGGSSTEQAPTVELGEGLHVLTLIVSGPSGESTDTVVVEVVADTGTTPGSPPTTPADGESGPEGGNSPDASSGCGCAAGYGVDLGRGWTVLLPLLLTWRRRRSTPSGSSNQSA